MKAVIAHLLALVPDRDVALAATTVQALTTMQRHHPATEHGIEEAIALALEERSRLHVDTQADVAGFVVGRED